MLRSTTALRAEERAAILAALQALRGFVPPYGWNREAFVVWPRR